MKYVGLLTDSQKRGGFFITQDEDFIYLWHGRNSSPDIQAIFLYNTATVKEIREKVKEDQNGLPGMDKGRV